MGSVNKDRILRVAEKFVLQGKFASAVNEYLKILKSEPDDVIILNTVGDLLVRLRKHAEAVGYFNRVVDLYLAQGFALKAIATLKKAFQLVPDNFRAQELLANLYHKQGLYYEACVHYKAVAERLFQTGKEREATEIFQKIFEFDKSDVDVLERLGNVNAARGDKQAAAEYIRLAGDACLKQGKAERSVQFLQRALDLNPRDGALIDLLVSASHAAGQDQLAESVLNNLLTVSPKDGHLRQLRARNLMHLGQLEQAEQMLLDLHESRLGPGALLELLGSYLERRDLDGFRRLSQKLVEILVGSDDLRGLSEVVQRATAQMTDEVSLLEMLARLHVRRNDLTGATAVQSELVSRYVLKGDLHKAFAAVDELLQWDPTNVEFRRQHRALFERVYPGKVYEEPSSEPEGAVELGLSGISVEDLERIRLASSGPEPAEALPFPGVTETAPFEIAAEDISPDALEENWETFLSRYTTGKPSENAPETVASELSFASVDADSSAVERESAARGPAESLEEVDFYLKMGFQVEARLLLEQLRTDFPDADEVQKRWQEVSGATLFQDEASARSVSALAPVPEKESRDVSLQIDEAVDSLFEFDPPEEKEARDVLQYREGRELRVTGTPPKPGLDFQIHMDLGTAYREMGLLPDAIHEFQQAIEHAGNDPGCRQPALCYGLLASCYLETNEPGKAVYWAQRGLKLPDTKEYEKRALFYDLGRAFEAQGNKEQALQFYDKIYKVAPNFRDVSDRVKQLRGVTAAG